jgi:eukaryotic-like serine/threonine-protein kinase
VVLLLVLGVAAYWWQTPARSQRQLTEKDAIVLADFDNSTGDPVFDGTLKQALAVDLEQSPFLNVMSDRRIGETLRLMGRGPNERITRTVAQEICIRTGSKAFLSGTIARLGNQYVLGLEAVNCGSGDSLAKEQAEAASKEDAVKALGTMASRLRTRLGESLQSVKQFNVPIEATTKSLDALKTFSMGAGTQIVRGDAEAIPFYRRAIEMDPNFAIAYARLGVAYSNLGQPSFAAEYLKKAYALRDGVSEREKFHITCDYYMIVTGEREKEAQTYELWSQSYPRDYIPDINLGAVESALGQYQKGIEHTEQGLKLSSINLNATGNLAEMYLAVGRTNDAKSLLDKVQGQGMDGGYLRLVQYYVAFLKNDSAGMQRQLSWASGKPGDEDTLLAAQAGSEGYSGRLRKARDFTRRATDSALRADSKETAALWQADAAAREAEFDNDAVARQNVSSALALAPGRDVMVMSALTLARIGDLAKAAGFVTSLEKSRPNDTVLKLYWLPTIKAAIELKKGNAAQALIELEAAAPYDLGSPPPFQVGTLHPIYLRGEAYLMTRQGKEAAAEFDRIIQHPGISLNFPTGSLARLGLGRAYAMQGDTAKARAAYQDFFTVWKEADPDIPILQQAKAEYAKLQ